VRDTQNYNIVEDLAQNPSVVSTLKVFQSCSDQNKPLVVVIGGVDPSDSNLVVFNHENHTPKLFPQAFMIQVVVRNKTIHYIIIDEGASTCIMSHTCWKAIGYLQLNQPPSTLKYFDGIGFKPYEIRNSLQVDLARKMVSIEVEVINGPLDDNLLLSQTWVYAMVVVV